LGAEPENDEGNRRAWFSRPRVVVALLTLGLCGSALYAFAPQQSASPSSATFSGAAGLQGKVEQKTKEQGDGRKKLVVEEDLSKFITVANLPSKAKLGAGGSPVVSLASDHLFDHVVSESGLKHELTEEELVAFKKRFINDMIGSEANKWWMGDYIQTSQKSIESTKPVMTKALAESWNKAQKGFEVEMREWMLEESVATFESRLNKVPFESIDKDTARKHDKNLGEGRSRGILPNTFDARDGWPMCADVIGRIHDQGHCGSCWVFGALGAVDSRICIKTNGSFSGEKSMLSRGFGASCAYPGHDGCQGGFAGYVLEYIDEHKGFPSASCVPYFASGAWQDHWTPGLPSPPCPSDSGGDSCDSLYPRHLTEDYFHPAGIGNYQSIVWPDGKGLQDMKEAIYAGGPIPFSFHVSKPFFGYKSGIYEDECGIGSNHAVQAIGWGAGYVLSQNSWTDSWGDHGRFKLSYCMVAHYELPGEINNTEYPLPIPPRATTTSTTESPPPPSELCATDAEGCVSSPNYPEPYGNSQRCDICAPSANASTGDAYKIHVESFATEDKVDYLEVNGEQFSGSSLDDGPEGVVPTTDIMWSSDSSIGAKGWKICFVPTKMSTTTAPTASREQGV